MLNRLPMFLSRHACGRRPVLHAGLRACLSTSQQVFDAGVVDPNKILTPHHFSCEVPMEDTDCYGIIHHANLVKYYDRARQLAFGAQALSHLEGAGVHFHVTAMNKINFSNPATLGMPLDVVSKIKDVQGPRIVWEQAITQKGSDKLITSALTETTLHAWKDKSEDHNVATFAENGFSAVSLEHLSSALKLQEEHGEQHAVSSDFESSVDLASAVTMQDFLYHDGVDASGRLSHLSVFCMMERSRVAWLGGAKGLKRLQQSGTLALVRGIDDFGLRLPCLPRAQTRVVLRTSALRAGRHAVACHQDVCVSESAGGEGPLLAVAGGRVTILFVDQKTMTPCEPPAWLLQQAGL